MSVDVKPAGGSGIGNPSPRQGGRGLNGLGETLLVPVEAGLSSRNAAFPKENPAHTASFDPVNEDLYQIEKGNHYALESA